MRFTIVGRVYPENAAVWFKRIESPTVGGGHFCAECQFSQLYVDFQDPKVSDLDSVKITAENLAQTYVGAIGFANGANYSVDITQVIREDGLSHCYGPKDESLAFNDETTFLECASLAGEESYFRFAVLDYCKSITNQIECGFYCYRAIEAIKCAFQDDWSKMHASLGTTKAEIETIVKIKADAIRHGNWSAIPITTHADRCAARRLTRDILHKYLKYRMSSRQQTKT